MDYLRVDDVARRLGVTPYTVRLWLREGRLAGYRISDRAGWRITEEAVAAFMQERSNRPQSEEEDDTQKSGRLGS